MSTIQAIILAVVEGITEFLPISSTGHMIIASSLMGIASDEFTKLFEELDGLPWEVRVYCYFYCNYYNNYYCDTIYCI